MKLTNEFKNSVKNIKRHTLLNEYLAKLSRPTFKTTRTYKLNTPRTCGFFCFNDIYYCQKLEYDFVLASHIDGMV